MRDANVAPLTSLSCAVGLSTLQQGLEDERLHPKDVTAELFESCLYTAECPPVGLLIRTSGENRLSDFMGWQCKDAVLVFLAVLWPDFSFWHLVGALIDYQRQPLSLQKPGSHYKQPAVHRSIVKVDVGMSGLLSGQKDQLVEGMTQENGCINTRARPVNTSSLPERGKTDACTLQKEKKLFELLNRNQQVTPLSDNDSRNGSNSVCESTGFQGRSVNERTWYDCMDVGLPNTILDAQKSDLCKGKDANSEVRIQAFLEQRRHERLQMLRGMLHST